jgi:hypothetical protein
MEKRKVPDSTSRLRYVVLGRENKEKKVKKTTHLRKDENLRKEVLKTRVSRSEM